MSRRFRIFVRKTYGGLPGLTWLICAAAFVNRAGAMVLPFLSLYLGNRFGYTVEEAGYVVGMFGVGSVVGSMLGGRLADQLGPVRLQIVTLTATAVWMAFLTFVTEPWALALGVFVLGAFNDAFRPGNVAAVAASCAPFRQAKALALNRLALNAGWAFGPALGGLLAQFDFRLLFWADGASCLGAAVLLAVCVPATLGVHTAHADAANPVPHASPLRDLRYLALLVCSTATFVVFLQQFQTMSRHLEAVLGYDPKTIGLLLIVNPAIVVLAEMPIVNAMRGRPMLPIVAVGAAAVGLAYAWLVPVGWGSVGVLASVLTITVGEMLYMPLLGAYVAERAPPRLRGRYLGLYFATFSLGFVIAPALGGFVYQKYGADALWLGCVATGLAGAAGFQALHRTAPAGRTAAAR